MDVPHFPLIEANQGLLSICALVLALGLAVGEHVRLLRARREDLAQTVATGVEVVNELEAIRAEAWRTWTDDIRTQAASGFGGEAKRAAELFRLLAGTTPITGKLALTLMRCSRRCEVMSAAGTDAVHVPERMKDAKTRLDICREELEKLRPSPNLRPRSTKVSVADAAAPKRARSKSAEQPQS